MFIESRFLQIYNIVLVSDIQHSDSDIYVYVCVCRINGSSLLAQTAKNPRAKQETWVRSLGWEDPLEKEMATHSSVLAWRSPWTEEPGRLQSRGSQRVRHDWATRYSTAQTSRQSLVLIIHGYLGTRFIWRLGFPRHWKEKDTEDLRFRSLEDPVAQEIQ